MKRIFAIISVLALLACCITPAFATSDEFSNDNFIELLDYDSVGDGTNYFSFNDSTTVTLDNPNNGIVNYVEILFFQSGQALNNVRLLVGNSYNSFNILSYGEGVYKAYTSTNANLSDIRLQFNSGSSSPSYITLLSCKVSQLNKYNFGGTTSFDVKYDIGSGLNEGGTTVSATMSGIGSKTLVNFNTHNTADGFYNFVSTIDLDSYHKYDFVDVLMQTRVSTIDSIVATWNGVNLPITVSYLFTDKFGSYVIDDDLFSWSDSHGDIVNINVRVDLRGIKKNISYRPSLTVRGSYDCQYNDNYFALLNYTGLISVPQKSPLLNLWYQLKSYLNSNHSDLKSFLTDLFKPDQSTQNQIDSSINNNEVIDQEISDGIADVGEDPGDLDLNDNLEEIGADPSYFIAFFTIIFNDYFIMRIFWVAALIMIIGYIFHGQR